MKLFNRIFGKQKRLNQNKEKSIEAIKLVNGARASAVTFYMPLLEEFPKLSLISDSGLLDEFDVLVTTASVGVVMTQVAFCFNSEETQQYYYAITEEISKWNVESSKSLFQFGRYIEDLTNRKVVNNLNELSESIGAWIFLELYENNPHNVELEELTNSQELFFVLGTMITERFSNYWKKD